MLLARKKMRSRGLALSVIISVLFLFVSEGKGAEAPISAEIKSATTYIFTKNAETFIPNGTGFFVGLKIPSKPNNFGLCLVTPKHVLYQPGTTQLLDTIYILLNKKGGGEELAAIPVRVQGNNKTVFMHSDPSVDIAAMPIMPDQKKYNFKFLPSEAILTKEASGNLATYEGAEVFYPSLFFPSFGSGVNYPFFRFGRFALITDEKIAWQGKPTALYLIETASNGANSGAPVFFYMESNRASVLKLAGVIQGTFGDALQEIKITEKNKTPLPFSNVGIAGVIPAYKLYELLFSEELKKQRGF
jgi:hypothetical protein